MESRRHGAALRFFLEKPLRFGEHLGTPRGLAGSGGDLVGGGRKSRGALRLLRTNRNHDRGCPAPLNPTSGCLWMAAKTDTILIK